MSQARPDREGVDNGLFITLVPKVLNNVFLFDGSTTLGIFNELWLVGSFSWLIAIYRRGNLCFIILDVHHFIGHCLIPLDPWGHIHVQDIGLSVEKIYIAFYEIRHLAYFKKVVFCLKLKTSMTTELIGFSILGKLHMMVLGYFIFKSWNGFKLFFLAPRC